MRHINRFFLFYGLARLCQYIQRLIIDNVDESSDNHDGIAKLIRVQKNLKYFEWKDDDTLRISRPGRDPYKEIVLAIENKVDTINHLKLDFNYRSPTKHDVLPKFYKLKILSVSFYYFSEEQLKMLVYRDLEIFEIDCYELKAAYFIIENSGGHLKKICLRPPYEIDGHSLLLVIHANDVIPEENQLLENGEELLEILIRSAPTSLREIRFIGDVKFSLETLEEFLEKWRGRPALSIITPNYILGEKKYKKLISKYKNNGVIKNFSCEFIENVVNMDFKI
ncbi:unnamed protein product [Rhizophagus irregularis]|nr:unnamed protein product [Rhizophagus irregularis]